jgi:predicted MFS family arabinose efflux permease
MTQDPGAHAPFFVCAFVWNLGLGMTYPLIPLYADSLGMSGVTIGALIALPVVLQITINLVGGAFTDRIGGRIMVLGSCLMMVAGASAYAAAGSFATLLMAQVLMVISRAIFWPASWTIAGKLPGERSVQVGRLNAMTNIGQIAGTFLAGFMINAAGFSWSFMMLAAIALAAFMSMLRHRGMAHADQPGPFAPMARYGRLIRLRGIWFAIMCAYISALPFSLSVSFYPLLFDAYGYSHEANGTILALRGVGAAVAGLLVARALDFSMKGAVAFASALVVAVSVAGVGATHNLYAVSALLFAVGLGSGLMSLNFQMLISDVSANEDRGSANALGGLGWGLSHFTTPLLMGVLRDHYGIESAFLILGSFVLTWAVALLAVHRWAFPARA